MKRAQQCAALFALLACLLPVQLAAQAGTISGHVQNRDGVPIAGATVRLAETSYGVLTGARGEFRLSAIPAGAYVLIAEQLGFLAYDQQITLTDSITHLKLVLAESPVALTGVVVTASGTAERHMTATTSIGAVTGPELRELRASHPAEVISRVAGAWVNVSGSGEGHMTSIRQPLTTNPVYLYLEDGVPTRSTGFFNHNALYEINMPQAGRVEVLKGPGTALYGSDAIGGVINVETRAPSLEPTIESYAEAGGYSWQRLLASASGSTGRHGLRADINLTRWSGWRDATGYDRQSATLRWDYDLGRARLKTLAAFSHIDQIDPSPLGPLAFRSNASLNEFPIATRSIEAFRLSTSLEAAVGGTDITLTPFLRSNQMQIVPSWMLSFDPVTYQSGHRSAGLVARARRELPALRGAITAGIDLDYSPGSRTEHRIDVARAGDVFTSYQRGALIYDYDVTFAGASPYLHLEMRPWPRLNVDAGLRYDHIAYDYENHLGELQTGSHRRPADASVAYHQLSPKLGLAYDLGSAALFGSYRQSFRAPSEGQLFRQGSAASTVDLKPIEAESFELGARAAAGHFDFEISLYDMRVHDDVLTFVTSGNQRESVNAGETRHRGVELAAGWQAAEWLRLDAAVTRAQHAYVSWQPRETIDYSGHEMERAPRTLTNLRARFSPALMRGGNVSVDWQRVGGYWEDPENTQRYGGHVLTSVRARYPVMRGFDVVARISNLFDERYAEHASYTAFEGERLTPGAPRMIYLGIQARWPEAK